MRTHNDHRRVGRVLHDRLSRTSFDQLLVNLNLGVVGVHSTHKGVRDFTFGGHDVGDACQQAVRCVGGRALHRVNDAQRHVHACRLLERHVERVGRLRAHVDANDNWTGPEVIVSVDHHKGCPAVTAQDARKMSGSAECLSAAANDDERGAFRQRTQYRRNVTADQISADDKTRVRDGKLLHDFVQYPPSVPNVGGWGGFGKGRVPARLARNRPPWRFVGDVHDDEFDPAVNRFTRSPLHSCPGIVIAYTDNDWRGNWLGAGDHLSHLGTP
jgi:hypothetical protein